MLFYVKNDGTIAAYTSAEVGGESNSNPVYLGSPILVNGNTVTASVPRTTAVTWRTPDQRNEVYLMISSFLASWLSVDH